jgi:hypothetical protein
MDAFQQKPEPSGRRSRVQASTSRRSNARGFLAAISGRPTGRRAERFRATGGRTGELRQHWQGAFVVTHIGRAGLIVQGAH